MKSENSIDSTIDPSIKWKNRNKKEILHDIYRIDRNNLTSIEME
jgi:hypothetical protein